MSSPAAWAARVLVDVDELGLEDMAAVAWPAVERNGDAPPLYGYGTMLAEIVAQDGASETLQILTIELMRHRLAHEINFVRMTKRGLVQVFPPVGLAKDMLAVPSPRVPRLRGVVHTPVLTADGRLLQTPGYDPESRLHLAIPPSLVVPPVAERPSEEEVEEAVQWIVTELLGDFPFVSAADRANAVAVLVTPLLLEVIRGGNLPLAAANKPQPRTGSTKLLQALSIIVGGDFHTLTITPDKAEMRKRLGSALLLSRPVLILDNAHGTVDSDALASILTSYPIWHDRVLGHTRDVGIPLRSLLTLTGNNLALSDELTTRSFLVHLDAKMERPWERADFKHPHLLPWVRAERGRLLWAALTLCRAWVAAGAPRVSIPFGGFEEWTGVVGGVLAVAGIDGFLANAADLFARMNDEVALVRAFVGAWWATHGTDPVTVKTLFELAQGIEGLPIQAKTDQGQRTRLGLWVKAIRERRVTLATAEGEILVRSVAAGDHNNAQRWQLERLDA